MKTFFITIHHNGSFKPFYENLTVQLGKAEFNLYFDPQAGYNAFTEFVYQKAFEKDKSITRKECLTRFPIVNIFELCM